jgi:hypothetical protein
LDTYLTAAITQLYTAFGQCPRPNDVEVCTYCATANVDPARLARADLRDWSDADLVAIHVLSLPDDALRYFVPRVFEVLLGEQWSAFEFGLSGLKGRTRDWPPAERDAIDNVLKKAWEKLLSSYPAAIGYVAAATDILELADQLDLPIESFLDTADQNLTTAADLHVASLVEFAYTTADKPTTAAIKAWAARPAIGERLEAAFYRADNEAVATELAAAYELWQVCTPRG